MYMHTEVHDDRLKEHFGGWKCLIESERDETVLLCVAMETLIQFICYFLICGR